MCQALCQTRGYKKECSCPERGTGCIPRCFDGVCSRQMDEHVQMDRKQGSSVQMGHRLCGRPEETCGPGKGLKQGFHNPGGGVSGTGRLGDAMRQAGLRWKRGGKPSLPPLPGLGNIPQFTSAGMKATVSAQLPLLAASSIGASCDFHSRFQLCSIDLPADNI